MRDHSGSRPREGAALFGYSELYGEVPGGQAELLRVPQAQFTHIKVPVGPPDSRHVDLSDVLPTAWQAVSDAAIPAGGSVTVLGLGPIGDMAARIAAHLGYEVIAVDRTRNDWPEPRPAVSGRSIWKMRGDKLADLDPRSHQRSRHRLGDRRRRDGGARITGGQTGSTNHRPAA